jgi:GAF domain-containing protein
VVELFELQSHEGPCLDCFRSGQPVVNQDLTTLNGRWPRFAPVAVAAGFRAADAIPMRHRGNVIGALNLFRTETGSLSEQDVAVAQALADIATIGILQHRETTDSHAVTEQLRTALTSRIVIEQAKGVIAERNHLPMDQAFPALRAHARNHNRRLVHVASEVIDGTLSLDNPSSAPPLTGDQSGRHGPTSGQG